MSQTLENINQYIRSLNIEFDTDIMSQTISDVDINGNYTMTRIDKESGVETVTRLSLTPAELACAQDGVCEDKLVNH